MALCQQFATPLILIPEGSTKTWRVYQDFVFHSRAVGTVVVPEGFLCDLNSIPRVFRWVTTPADFPRSGVLHDYAYATQMPRAQADALYREALECERASGLRRWTRWTGLRLFGWLAYRSHRQENE